MSCSDQTDPGIEEVPDFCKNPENTSFTTSETLFTTFISRLFPGQKCALYRCSIIVFMEAGSEDDDEEGRAACM